jgi:hypothetical protein
LRRITSDRSAVLGSRSAAFADVLTRRLIFSKPRRKEPSNALTA